MSELDVYLRLRAHQRRRAVPATTRRHVRLADPPLVVVGYHLAGEVGAPVCLCYGTAPDAMRTVLVAEPRDRTQRFAALTTFAADLAGYLDGFTERAEQVRPARRGSEALVEQVCVASPQLVVPNTATAAWLCDTLGRSLRYLRTDGERPVDALLPAAGAHLTFLATRRVLPGTASVLAATALLCDHWRTGQLPTEDANLHALLGWIDPPAGTDGPTAALAGEALPAAGPVPDPGWDADVLRPAVESHDTARVGEVATAALAPTWRATWRSLDLLARLPEAPGAERRAQLDHRSWTHHLDRVEAGTAHFSRRLDALRSFSFLAELEKRTADLEREQALDDPLLMARYVASGEALVGTVVGRDLECFEPSAKGNPVRRPRVRIHPELAFDRPPGTSLWVAERASVQLRVGAPGTDGEVACTVVKGMGRTLPQADAAVPQLGTRVVLAPFGPADTFPTNLPDELPWTHRQPAVEE